MCDLNVNDICLNLPRSEMDKRIDKLENIKKEEDFLKDIDEYENDDCNDDDDDDDEEHEKDEDNHCREDEKEPDELDEEKEKDDDNDNDNLNEDEVEEEEIKNEKKEKNLIMKTCENLKLVKYPIGDDSEKLKWLRKRKTKANYKNNSTINYSQLYNLHCTKRKKLLLSSSKSGECFSPFCKFPLTARKHSFGSYACSSSSSISSKFANKDENFKERTANKFFPFLEEKHPKLTIKMPKEIEDQQRWMKWSQPLTSCAADKGKLCSLTTNWKTFQKMDISHKDCEFTEQESLFSSMKNSKKQQLPTEPVELLHHSSSLSNPSKRLSSRLHSSNKPNQSHSSQRPVLSTNETSDSSASPLSPFSFSPFASPFAQTKCKPAQKPQINSLDTPTKEQTFLRHHFKSNAILEITKHDNLDNILTSPSDSKEHISYDSYISLEEKYSSSFGVDHFQSSEEKIFTDNFEDEQKSDDFDFIVDAEENQEE
ncbi:uncharacterized protein MONOS_4059 [Monocercomonoides exilis]|uniref:uncharacterized protein n=1 Tax=Monocercomonoides exilis TaxID=2049356 RepID=UPI00355AB56A|nr:hypothetical protein MONOS_4059 [Monocercomonoides exilis]|eukprot:MONOS_4059.1-p1 / transcript=MONOS_4059.1 / gene=MONOS_4059 / organism=Monocercomonoides_exilis_PA203 / gene_product=unspecified product / transcript_product=unspecified product / location=Mono_scaffold00103:53524-54972(-) / protein_length=483 / sequence_SO=supercontig / SO=protein_coding / is_pseudo=false